MIEKQHGLDQEAKLRQIHSLRTTVILEFEYISIVKYKS